MKNFFIIVLCGMLSYPLCAAELTLKKDATVYVTVNNINMANEELQKLIVKYNMVISNANVNNSKKICQYDVYVSQDKLNEVIPKIEGMGLTELKEIKSYNYNDLLEELNYDLTYLKKQNEIYKEERNALKKDDKSYTTIFEKERELDQKIYEITKKKSNLNRQGTYSLLKIKISEKNIQDLDGEDDFSGFINMPGAEFKYFHIENNEEANVAHDYFGASLRYMFTKGRSYFTIGVLKSINGGDEKESVNDIVSYSIGKDFYPRYFGQGKNKFFNPFSGFEGGGLFMSSEEDVAHMFSVEPHLGIELYKNKLVIIDTRVGYLFPVDKNYIRTRRGLTAYFSCNIVF